jgi:hypothetical protein
MSWQNDQELIFAGLSVADGSMICEDLLERVLDHRE